MEIFHRILNTAIQGGASDVHIKVGTPIVFRISRQLIPIEAPTPTDDWMNNVVANIVPKHAQRRLDEEREVDFSYYLPGVGRFRTNLFQQRGQFCLAMRYVKTQIPSFEELGLMPILKKIALAPRGIILLAGSTGCGKSTTLAAMIQHINATSRKHLITLEDPIEFVFEDNQSVIEQREIGLDTPIVRTWIEEHPSTGPGYHYDRRNARFHQFFGGHERRRYRPSRVVNSSHHKRRAVGRANSRFFQG